MDTTPVTSTGTNTPHPSGSTSPAAGAATRSPSWLAVLSVAVGAFAFVATEYLPVGLLPPIAHDLGITPGIAGLMVTTPGVVAAFSAPALLLAAGRINRRAILLLLAALLLASNLISAVAPNFAVMLIGRFVLGMSLGGFWTVALGASGQLASEERAAQASATIFMGITLATVIGVPLATLIAELSSWRMAFVATAGLASLALAAQAIFLPSLPPKSAVRLQDLRSLLGRSTLLKSLLVVLLGFGAHFSSYTYIAPFLEQSASFTPAAVTALLLAFGVVGFIANFAISTVVAHHLKRSLGSMVALVMLALIALPLLAHSHAGVAAAVIAWGIAYGAIPLCLSIWMSFSTPDQPEAGSSMFVSTVQTAIASGSLVGGAVVDHFGIPATMHLGAWLAFAGIVMIATFSTRHASLKDVLAR
ncbi:putative MFS family arabinose efflux permease [Pararobbsia alpina]|uniref:MFS transporter n=1 Tax=Pararobbsia alpina TaxID=621374 RepID=UPI0039A5F04D